MKPKHLQLVEIYVKQEGLTMKSPNLHSVVKSLKSYSWKCFNPNCNNIIDLNSCKNKIKRFCSLNCVNQTWLESTRTEEYRIRHKPRMCICGKPTPMGNRGIYLKFCSNKCKCKDYKERKTSRKLISLN